MDGETVLQDDEMKSRLVTLEAENMKMREEFNGQRAKMKELFLQKEGECKKLDGKLQQITKELDEAKSQLVVAEYHKANEIQTHERRAQDEIASLQHLIQETFDESASTKDEFKKLRDEYERIRTENHELRDELTAAQDTPGLAPVLNHVKKTLARKVRAASGTGNSDTNLEDSMRKVNKYAQEDAEVLRSLVVPLEEEIKALKEKLRSADEELQAIRGPAANSGASALVGMLAEQNQMLPHKVALSAVTESNNTIDINTITSSNTSSVHPPVTPLVTVAEVTRCELCASHEEQLVQAKDTLAEHRVRLERADKTIERLREELEKDGALRRDLETQWQEKRELHKEEVQRLTEQIHRTERSFTDIQSQFTVTREAMTERLHQLVHDREKVQRNLEHLQRDNDWLAGKYLENSAELNNQEINLPDRVDELQELHLKLQQNLIEARVGCEYEQKQCQSLRDEVQLLKDKLDVVYYERREDAHKIRTMEDQLRSHDREHQELAAIREAIDTKDMEHKKTSTELRSQVIELSEAKNNIEKVNIELRNKITTLQNQLSTSEFVQKDFVRLSQSLQMELEKIRGADTEVRWQDDDDANECNNCRKYFTVTRRKEHCRHCGKIFCDRCLQKCVPSGPQKRSAHVCDVCHTLLVQNTAPYFSRAPPQSPM